MGALNAAGLALQAQEQVISVISNNVANAQTPGYAREEANLVPAPAVPLPGAAGEIGTGVEVASVTRDDSAFLDRQAYAANSALSQYQTTQNALGQVETIFNEPSQSSLSNALSAFWQSWSSLGNDPSNAAARTSVIAQGQSVAETFNGIAKQLTELQQSIDTTVADQVTEVNQIAGQIAKLNLQISEHSASGQPPNELLDQRAQLLTKLSGLVQFQEVQHSDGTDAVIVGGVSLVDGSVTTALKAKPDPTNNNFQQLYWAGTSATVQLGDGSLGANVTLRDDTIPGYLSKLDALASDLASAVNGVANPATAATASAAPGSTGLTAGTYYVSYSFVTPQGETLTSPPTPVTVSAGQQIDVTGIAPPAGDTVNYYLSTAPGSTTMALAASGSGTGTETLTALPAAGASAPPTTGIGHAGGYGANGTTGLDFFTGTTAATIAVNPTVANNPDDVAAASKSGVPGDGSNALAIADLENSALAGSSSIGDAYGALISGLGVDAQTAGNAVQTQQLLLTRVQQEQQSVSGVDLNQEMTNMVSSQHAYQAASDVINAVNQMLQSLLGTVG